MKRLVLAAAFSVALSGPATAASLDGITLADMRMVGGTPLRLNGIALRTYSLLRIHIYVAGLYLEHPTDDAEQILRSPEKKMLDIRFVHDVDAASARKAWLEGFDSNCESPCPVNRSEIDKFLAAVTDMRKGDVTALVFTPGQVAFQRDGQTVGTVKEPLASVILASFIGPVPPTERLKRELLGGHG